MQKIISSDGLQKAIMQLESDQKKQAGLLKIQFNLTTDSLKPINLLRSAVEDIVKSPLILLIGIETIKLYGHRLIDRIFRSKETDTELE